MNNVNLNYEEKISSMWTELLFLALALIFLLLSIWRLTAVAFDVLTVVCLFFFVVFTFYSLNYYRLIIRISNNEVRLAFGIFSWTVPFSDIEGIQSDDNLPALYKYGGAGVHFFLTGNRYRVSFNFLEYSRVAIRLKQKVGPVTDVSFSTRRPEEVIRLITERVNE